MNDNSMDNTTPTTPFLGDDSTPELRQFEDFARRAIELGFTIHLNHYRFHPAHIACARCIQSGVELSIIPIREHTKEQFCENWTLRKDSISAVLEEGQRLIDRYAAGERLPQPTRQPRRSRISDEERERRRERMKTYWRKKRGEAAETTADDAVSDQKQ
jgi:hypothetical protein